MRIHRLLLPLGAAVIAALTVLGAPACSTITGIAPLQITDCKSAADCDDHNPCTVDTCEDKNCKAVIAPDGPTAGGAVGDCRSVTCVVGVAIDVPDNADPPADEDTCHTGSCSGGLGLQTPKINGTHCTEGQATGICTNGACVVGCTTVADCDDKNPCTTEACPASTCVFTKLDGVPTPGATQTSGNCRQQSCVAGVDTDAPDDTDAPVPPNDCVGVKCSGGLVVTTPHPIDSPCNTGGGKVCSASEACVACTVDAECPGTIDDCQHPGCNPAGSCGTVLVADGTEAATQTSNDCMTLVCMSGIAVSQVDVGDVPVDGNDCTQDLCAADGTPSNPKVGAGSACGVGQACNATGQCGCANDAQCNAPNTCGGGSPGTPFTCGCTPKTCAQVMATCGTASDGCFGTQPCNNNAKDGSETDIDCGGGGKCTNTCGPGKHCAADGDCSSGFCADGVCCNNACNGSCQACSAALKGSGTDGVCGNLPFGAQDNSPACNGASICDGNGGCKKANGQTCVQNGNCASSNCVDGYCCNNSCGGICQACNLAGSVGTCTNIAPGQMDPTCSGGNVCDGTGSCKKLNGQTCAAASTCFSGSCADGYCCNSACNATCMACNLAGSVGNCTNTPVNIADPGTCAGALACDGSGQCKLGTGQFCSANSDCASGTCDPMSFVCQ